MYCPKLEDFQKEASKYCTRIGIGVYNCNFKDFRKSWFPDHNKKKLKDWSVCLYDAQCASNICN